MAVPGRLPELRPAPLRRRLAVRQPGEVGDPAASPSPKGRTSPRCSTQAEDIVNAAAPDILAEFDKKQNKGVFRRKGQGKGKGKGKRKR